MTYAVSRSEGLARCPVCDGPLAWLGESELECRRCRRVHEPEVLL